MRVPVYRNLDSPFRIGGFKPLELVLICSLFVTLSELSSLFGINRAWAFLFTICFAGILFWMRKALGEEFPKRAVRFLSLPSQLYARPFWMRRFR
jgi:hypothetical protein